jgi:phosphoglycolate phosphatase
MAPPTIVFDLDGTLVDTAPDLVSALNVTFAREGLPAVEYEVARNMIGGGAERMIKAALKFEGRNYSKSDLDRMLAEFIAYYSEHIADQSQIFPGLTAALDTLASWNCRLAVCTNKLELLSKQLLDTLGLSRRFNVICGQDTFGIQKPNPVILRRTIEAVGGEARQAIMIGDSETDIATARAAAVPVVAVDFGYSEKPIATLGADRLISHFDELIGAIQSLVPDLPAGIAKSPRKKPS